LPRELYCLGADDIIEIHRQVTGERDPQLRSPALLESAVFAPFHTCEGKDMFPSQFHKAAALLRSLAENQPFVDGNKRTAWIAMRTFLIRNHIEVEATVEDVVHLMLRLANKKVGVEDIVEFLVQRARFTS